MLQFSYFFCSNPSLLLALALIACNYHYIDMQKYLFLLLFCCLSVAASAQTDRQREEAARQDLDYYNRNKPSRLANRSSSNLWYGGGLQLGFSSTNFQSFFNVGISPMVGYKVTNNLSFGPRVALAYNSFKRRNTNDDFSSNYLTWAVGVFGRMRVFNEFFIHTEYSLESDIIGFVGNEPVRRNRSVPYLGAGYSPFNPGGGSSEFVVLFRLASSSQIIREAPYVFRAGINFNF